MSMFRFKQFEVDQSGCAMKINTDGVLLAALATTKNPAHILDIGTGTGVMALMLAQRFADAQVQAVEIDGQAAATAAKNCLNSPFHSRLSVQHVAIEAFQSRAQFDLVVSNPPYFVNDLKNAEAKKGLARHTNEQFFEDLVGKVASLLSAEGCFWFILPVKQAELLIHKATRFGLQVSQQIHLHSDAQKPAFRYLVCLQQGPTEATVSHFYIYESEKVYTQAYKALLKDFFLGY